MFINIKLYGVLLSITTKDNNVSMHIILKILEETLEKLNHSNVKNGTLKAKLPLQIKANVHNF